MLNHTEVCDDKAVGESLWLNGRETKVPVAIVGVIDTVRWRDLTTDLSGSGSDPDVYFPFAQAPSRSVEFALRVKGTGDNLLPRIRRAVGAIDAEIAVLQLTSLNELLDRSNLEMERVLAEDLSSPSQQASRREQAVIVADALAALPEDYREVVILRQFQQLKFIEIGTRMGRSAGAARVLWVRALERLRSILGESQ